MSVAVPCTHQTQPGWDAAGLQKPHVGPNYDSLNDAELALAMQEEEYVSMPPQSAISEQVGILVGKRCLMFL